MAIVSGYQKMKDYIKQSSGYKLLSRWTNANTVECDDAQTVQNKIGGITGISSSLTANSSTQAASTNLTNQLYQNMNQLSSELGNRFGNNINLQSLPLNSAIAYILDNNFATHKGSFDVVISTSDGWYRVEGYRDFDGSGFGFANKLGGANIPYCYDRTAGADAVLKKLGDGYKVDDWSMSNNGTHWAATYDTGHQVIWAGANNFQVAQAGQPTGGGPTCSMTVTWSGTVITCATWGTNQGTTVTGKYIYQE